MKEMKGVFLLTSDHVFSTGDLTTGGGTCLSSNERVCHQSRVRLGVVPLLYQILLYQLPRTSLNSYCYDSN